MTSELDNKLISKFFDINRTKDALLLNSNEVSEYLKQFDNEDFVIFDNPLYVDTNVLFRLIGRDVFWVIQDLDSPGGSWFYLFAKTKNLHGKNKQFYNLEKYLEYPFMLYVGLGYEEGVDYIEWNTI